MEVLKSLYNVLSIRQKRQSIFQIILMIISMIFELLSITLVLPVIAVISDDDFLIKYPLIESFIFFIDSNSKYELLIYFMFIFMFVYLVKSIVLAYIVNHNYKFIFSLQSSFSNRLFKGYLTHPFSFHLKKNSAELIQNSILIVNNVTSSLVSIIQLATELISAFSIGILVVIISPSTIIITALVFVPSIYLFLKILKNKLTFWGKQFQYHDNNRIQLLQQGLSTVKEIKLISKEDFFSKNYAKHTLGGASFARKQQFFQAMPRLFIEFLMMLTLTLIVSFLIFSGEEFNSILILLGVFAAASFRLLPSMNRITSSIQTLRYSSSFIKTLENDLVEISKIEINPFSSQKITINEKIIIQNLSFSYPDSKNLILDNINLEICKGNMIGIIGTTGEGKSTLVNIILGLLSPNCGNIIVDGVNIFSNLKSWQQNTGYVPQTISLIDDSLRRNIAFGLEDDKIDDKLIIDCLFKTELKNLYDSLENGLDTKLGERGIRFSGGERQRIGIARALYNNPEVIVFDEATSSLDVKTENEIMDSINLISNNKTVIMITHRPRTLKNCDKVFKINNGKLREITNG